MQSQIVPALLDAKYASVLSKIRAASKIFFGIDSSSGETKYEWFQNDTLWIIIRSLLMTHLRVMCCGWNVSPSNYHIGSVVFRVCLWKHLMISRKEPAPLSLKLFKNEIHTPRSCLTQIKEHTLKYSAPFRVSGLELRWNASKYEKDRARNCS